MNTTHLQYGGGNGEGTNVTDLNEEAITNGILKLTSVGSKLVCFTSGEGEADPDDAENPNGFAEFKATPVSMSAKFVSMRRQRFAGCVSPIPT